MSVADQAAAIVQTITETPVARPCDKGVFTSSEFMEAVVQRFPSASVEEFAVAPRSPTSCSVRIAPSVATLRWSTIRTPAEPRVRSSWLAQTARRTERVDASDAI